MCGGARVDEEDFLFLSFRHSWLLHFSNSTMCIFCIYPDIYLETFWPAFILMKMSKGKPTRKRMEKYVIKLLGQNLKKERKLYGRFHFHKAMVFYIIC